MEAFIGVFIKKKRLELNYSQAGLCRGICVGSYLSKIENGQANVDEDIIKALLQRLKVSYNTDAEFLHRAHIAVENAYKLIFASRFHSEFEALTDELQQYLNSRYMLDVLLITQYARQCTGKGITEDLSAYQKCMDKRRLELYLLICLENNSAEIDTFHTLSASAFFLTSVGTNYCTRGKYMQALDILTLAFTRACNEGTVYNMLRAKLMMGDCYSAVKEKELMLQSYNTALNIAECVDDEAGTNAIFYNIGATLLQWGENEEALKYMEKTKKEGALFFHKYAICLENLGRKKQAKSALNKGRQQTDFADISCMEQMYALVEYRLENKNYIKHAQYSQSLKECIANMEKSLPYGFVQFHISYLAKVLEAERRYKEAYELLKKSSVAL